jgi:hypothetical protein
LERVFFPPNASVEVWNNVSYRKIWNESSTNHRTTTQHTIGDFPINTAIQIKKNGVLWNTYTSNSPGYISFNYDGGYSDNQFQADPIASSTISTITRVCAETSTTTNAAFGLLGILLIGHYN